MTKNTYVKNGDQEFADKAGKALKQANEHLDAATLSRLNRARQTALTELGLQRGPRIVYGGRWLPAGALAASVAVATVLWLGRDPGMTETNLIAEQFEDLDILLSDEEFELYDDLEFFSWLGGELDVLDDEQGQG